MLSSSDAARVLGRLPKARRHERTCPMCGKTFMATAKGKFCSAICKAHDQTRRKTEARRARREQPAPAEAPASN